MTGALAPLLVLLAARIAIVVSADHADGQPPLRFTERDGDRMAQTLGELGDFTQVTRLRQPTLRQFEQALDDAEAHSRDDPALQVFIYYSGHADETGLLMGGEKLAYPALRRRLEESHAAVRVAVLDACHTGSVVKAKGGTPAPGFAIPPPVSNVRGAAIFSASRSDELAQESSEVEGSFFTHHLLSALRGAGDRDGNGAVTIGEAYQYAYDRTLASTWPSLLGPQHAAYEYQLSGTGDLVLTRLTSGRQALSFPAGAGPPYIVTSSHGDVVAEVSPDGRRGVRIVLPPGKYRITTREHDRARQTEVTLQDRAGDVTVAGRSFQDVPVELAFGKGFRPEPLNELFADVALTGFGPGVLGLSPEVAAGYFRRSPHFTYGPRLGYGHVDGALEGVPYHLTRWKAMVFGLRRFPISFWDLEAGIGVGASSISEHYNNSPTLDDHQVHAHYGRAPAAAAALAIELPLWRWLALRLQWGVGADFLWVSQHLRLSPELTSSFAVALRL